MTVLERLRSRLLEAGIPFTEEQHAPVFTSAEAASVRGTTMASGAKALVLKVDDGYVLCVMPADCKLESKRVKKQLKAKSIRFATREELLEKTGLEPGSVPPFGSLFGIPTILDGRLKEQAIINFNAGDHSVSFTMTIENYLRAEAYELLGE